MSGKTLDDMQNFSKKYNTTDRSFENSTFNQQLKFEANVSLSNTVGNSSTKSEDISPTPLSPSPWLRANRGDLSDTPRPGHRRPPPVPTRLTFTLSLCRRRRAAQLRRYRRASAASSCGVLCGGVCNLGGTAGRMRIWHAHTRRGGGRRRRTGAAAAGY